MNRFPGTGTACLRAGAVMLICALHAGPGVAQATEEDWLAVLETSAPASGAADGDATSAGADGPPDAGHAADDATDDAQAELPTIPVPQVPAPAPPREPARGQLEEIVVTAQKRGVQAIKDVPVSISVIDEELIVDWGIGDVREAMLFVPNVKVEQAGFFASPRVRGFSFNNNNKAFEPPAGIAMEGVPYGRVEYFAAGLFDTQRIEVLRGPQGTTFGKNTTAGLINILSRDPTDTFEGFVDVQRGSYDRERLELGVGGPLVEDLVSMRIAAVTEDRRGFVYNTTADVDPQAERYMRGDRRDGVRAKLRFPSLGATDLKLSYESVDLESLGTGVEIVQAPDAVKARIRAYDPGADFVARNYISSLDSPDNRHTAIDTFVVDAARALGDWDLALLGGHSLMKTTVEADIDFTPAKAIFAEGHDQSPTTTLELRLLSPGFEGAFGLGSGSSDLLLGLFAQRTAIEDSLLRFHFFTGPLLDLTLASQSGGAFDPVAGPIGLIPALPPDIGDTREQSSQYFEQNSDTLAAFGQAQWTFLPAWTLQLGLRLSHERKDASWLQVFDSAGPNLLMRTQGLEPFAAAESLSETNVQPKLSVNWQPADGLSLFAHWARAYKSGGFNAFAFRGAREELVYDPEYSTEWGVDLKSTLLQRTLQLNVSLYRMDIDDFQVLTRVPETSAVGLGVSAVENAATARAQGIEGDLTWLAAHWLRVMASFGMNDTEYLDFKTNDCPADRPNTDRDEDARCDASGKPFAFAPRWNGTFGFHLTPPFELGGATFNLGVVAEYQSRQFLDIDLDDRKVQDAFWRTRISAGIQGAGGWSFKLLVENLNDAATYIRQGDVMPGVFVGALEPPRMVFGQLRWVF
ncbi:MAG: TonB-dependent receptor [Sinimarinibacterium flocculans]|uniref:TonB-dependent receptor n=1 Tax=Sinimarinibacterium flocculans TaxID=985250 RepID=UPI003C586F7C